KQYIEQSLLERDKKLTETLRLLHATKKQEEEQQKKPRGLFGFLRKRLPMTENPLLLNNDLTKEEEVIPESVPDSNLAKSIDFEEAKPYTLRINLKSLYRAIRALEHSCVSTNVTPQPGSKKHTLRSNV
ncbi:hypothetical protein ABNF65_20040, partial [Paenibacillus larvae]